MRRPAIPKDLDMKALRNRLEEAENTLQSIYHGEVDSLVVSGPHGKQVFALQGTDHSYRLLVEGMQEGALTFSPIGDIFYVNRALATLVNAPLPQIIGSSIYSLFRGASSNFVKRMMAAPDGPGRRTECFLTTHGNEQVPVQLSLTQLAIDQGTAFCMLITNLTERKSTEMALEISQRALSRAQKMEAVGRLAAGVAHDFNNLTTGIQGISQELLESFEGQDPRRDDIQEILKATERAFSVTKQLLAFSRRQMTVPTIIDVKAAIVEMNKLLHRLLGEDIDIQLGLGVLECTIKLDPGQLEQIIMNLALNARDAMPGGGILTIRTSLVTLKAEDFHLKINNKPGLFVKIEVADNGTGMDKETLEHIFEPFFTTKDIDKGTGLGLATVYGIVEQARGDIHVVSKVNKGSTLKIYLPACAEKAAPLTNRTLDSLQKPNTEMVLVIEDDDVVRRVVVGRLTRLGYTVLEASSGRKAIGLVKSHPDIKLVLSDVMMPQMNGRQAVEAIQVINPSIKALYMSAYPSDVIAEDGMLQKGVAFIDKAALGSDLPCRIRELLDTR
jgi:two-component system cell cycle sensor histidine kinase/response regulator CckA